MIGKLSWRAIALGTVACVYPLLLWAMLEAFGARAAAAVGLLSLALVTASKNTKSTAQQSFVRFGFSSRALPIGMLALLTLSLLSGDERLLKLLPVGTNLLLLSVFGFSLRAGGTPTLHEFARAIEGRELLGDEARHCRRWTWLWCAFFVCNIMLTSALAIFGTRFGWALHTSLLSYVAMAVLFAAEYLARLRMRRMRK